jgi:uncharacterized protein YcfJ
LEGRGDGAAFGGLVGHFFGWGRGEALEILMGWWVCW